jgi:nickel transport protein
MNLNPIRMCSALLLAVVALAPTSFASAHDVWLTFSGEAATRRIVVNYGHPDDRPPTMPDKILDLAAIAPAGASSLLSDLTLAQDHGAPVVVSRPFADSGNLLLAARYDNGFWIRTADGLYRNATRRLVPNAADSMWSGKFAKALTGPDAPWQRVVGHDLEIVPLSDPGMAKPGQTLRLKVLFHGKPLSGIDIERGDGVTAVAEQDIPRFATDADGIASIPVVKAGPHLLVVDHRVTPSATPDQANADLFNATLWFNAATARP